MDIAPRGLALEDYALEPFEWKIVMIPDLLATGLLDQESGP